MSSRRERVFLHHLDLSTDSRISINKQKEERELIMGVYIGFVVIAIPCILFLLYCLTPRGKNWLRANGLLWFLFALSLIYISKADQWPAFAFFAHCYYELLQRQRAHRKIRPCLYTIVYYLVHIAKVFGSTMFNSFAKLTLFFETTKL